jgi:thiamine biosynthesis lipoprotein ApbE
LGTEGGSPWKIAIENPHAENDPDKIRAVVELEDESLSVSAVWGKYFVLDGKLLGHVIDPRTGWPAENALLGAVILESATATDALSTAVVLGNDAELGRLTERVPNIRYLQMRPPAHHPILCSRGITPISPENQPI